jgi:hypothetical protein
MKTFTMIVDRHCQNTKGESIIDFKAFFDTLLNRVGYIKAKTIIRQEYHIFIHIK